MARIAALRIIFLLVQKIPLLGLAVKSLRRSGRGFITAADHPAAHGTCRRSASDGALQPWRAAGKQPGGSFAVMTFS
ncbi:hypothetical protein [Aurantimonas sp. 22II-16-19i]|uniref:hypothetical protein n=1 Tax=Aurantimonas sp. 22II-16-19i TaxID=1317114 RepID=UPI0015946087|nr:hypothetical protein [Aurantimonas sp. 22II-16-19i]